MRKTLPALLALILLWPAAAGATQMVRASVEALSQHSRRVVLGVVRSAEPRLDPGSRRGIYTAVTLQVEETWRGPASPDCVFWVHGGRVGDRAMRTHGQATFTPGEHVVVFLEATADGALFPVGMSQGKWSVEGDRVWSRAAPDALVDRGLRPAAPLAPRSLDALRRAVRSAR